MPHPRSRVRTWKLPASLDQAFRKDLIALIEGDDWSNHGFAETYLLKESYRKYVSPETDPAPLRQQRAIEKWLKADLRNRRTNQRLFWDNAVICGIPTDDVVEFARKRIRWLISETPDLRGILQFYGEFTNGASTRLKRTVTASARKYVGKAHATPEALALFKAYALNDSPLWEASCEPELVHGSVMFTVPKDSTIDRVACKEPEVNMYLQRSVGIYFRECLRKVGINLRDQTSNARAARRGSRDGSLATIDLSSASDLISTTLVNRLLPIDWYDLLDKVRVKRTLLPDGQWHELEMFSSMGNGFTFELETIVFWALASAIKYFIGEKGRTLVYGDDIVVPPVTARVISRMFPWFGFVVNTKKTHITGYFRESCGGHYHRGKDVTPFYVRGPLVKVTDLILILNEFRAWSSRTALLGARSERYFDFWLKYSSYIPQIFWGGRDCGASSALVSPHSPRKMLVPVRNPASDYEDPDVQLGSYLRALNALARRELEGYIPDPLKGGTGSGVPTTDGRLVVRPAAPWDHGIPLFMQEWATPVSAQAGTARG